MENHVGKSQKTEREQRVKAAPLCPLLALSDGRALSLPDGRRRGGGESGRESRAGLSDGRGVALSDAVWIQQRVQGEFVGKEVEDVPVDPQGGLLD